MAAPPSQPKPSYLALLRERSFASLWVGQLVSQSGDAIFDIALLWLVLSTTGSIFLVGLTQALVLLPGVLVGPIAGVYVDRFNRRDIMILSSLAQGVVTATAAILYLLSLLSFPVLVVLIILLYTGAQFYLAANSAIIPSMVPRENLGAANGLFTMTTSTNQLVAYSLGGLIFLAFGASVPITYDSITFFFAAAMLFIVTRSYGQVSVDGSKGTAQANSFREDFRQGLSYVRESRFFLELIVVGVIVNGFAGAVFAIMAPYAKFQVHGDVSTLGFLLAAFLLGNVVGSVIVGKMNFRAYVGRLLFFGIITFGVVLALAGFATTVPVAFAEFSVMGVFISTVNIPISTLVQAKIPRELLGRARTILGAFLSSAQPIASIIAGSIAAAATIGAVFVGAGLAVALLTAALYLVFEELRSAKF